MPKDEFDFEDPFELNGMAFMTQEDTTNDMAETFVEEFMRARGFTLISREDDPRYYVPDHIHGYRPGR